MILKFLLLTIVLFFVYLGIDLYRFYTYCSSTALVSASNLFSCNSWGNCGALLDNGAKVEIRMPVIGEKVCVEYKKRPRKL